MELDTIKDIAAIAAPLTKVVIDTFLAPKFQEIREKLKRENRLIDYAYEDKFFEYLNESYEKNAILNTLAFKKKKVLLNNVYIPLELFCPEEKASIKIIDYTDVIFSESNKILITDTAGMGKSTLSRKLLISCIEQNKGVPILIELRRLSKTKDIIDEILEQLNPINENIDKQFILDLIRRGDFIFFFDGFDEISLSDRSKVTGEIQQFVSKARQNKFILTSRPEDALSSFGDFQKYQIKPLNPEEAYELIKKYDDSGKISQLLISKIQEKEIFKSVEEYLTTPLLVSLLYTAFEHKQSIPFKKHIFYRQVFDALFESHDLSKGDSFERDKHSGLGSDEFHRVLRIFGYLCLKSENKIEFNKDELNNFIQKSIDYCSDIKAKTSDFIKDILVNVPIFSKDGIYYKWSHKSLQEYFAAQFIYLDTKEKQQEILIHVSFHYDNTTFINVIDLYRSMDPLGFEQTIIYEFLKRYFNYLNSSYCAFSGPSKIERQKITFGHDVYLINFPFYPKTKENHPREIFNLLRKYFDHKRPRMSIGIDVAKEKLISFIKVPEIRNPNQTLLEYFYSNRFDFVGIKREKNIEDDKLEIDLKLPFKKIIKVTDRKNSIINKDSNFQKTNDIIKLYLFRRSFIYVDDERAKELFTHLQHVKQEKKADKLMDF